MILKLFFIVVAVAVSILVVLKFSASHRESPAASWIVEDSEGKIACTSPDGVKSSVTWSDLQSIQMETNDRGPIEPDVFWILKDSRSTCRFPTGARGEKELNKKLFSMQNFDLKLFMEQASTSTQNRLFNLWTAR